MKNRDTSLEIAVLPGSAGQFQEAQPAWRGPRFEIDDDWPTSTDRHGVRRALSALTLAMLIVVGGVGFFHKILPQMIDADKAKQAAKAKKLAGKKDQPPAALAPGIAAAPNVANPADEERQRKDSDDALNAARDRLEEHRRRFDERRAEQWRRHEEFIERHRKRHEEAFGGLRGVPGGFDRVVPPIPDSLWKGNAPIQPVPDAANQELERLKLNVENRCFS